MIWNTAFEGSPAGGDFASVSGLSLRNLKTLFKSMLEAEHTFDEGDSPTMIHKAGYCSVVGLDFEESDTIGTNAIAEVNGTIKHSDGIEYVSLGSIDHRNLLGLTEGDPHTQYVKKSVAQFQDVSIDDIQGILQVSYPNVGNDNEVLDRANHIGGTGGSGVHHADAIIADADIELLNIPKEKIALEENTLGSGVSSVTVSDSKYHGSFNCFYVDTNYLVEIRPTVNQSGNFRVVTNPTQTGDITSVSIPENGV